MKHSNTAILGLADVRAASKVVLQHVCHTPLVPSTALGRMGGGEVYLKPECWQRTGSFKERGAVNKLASLTSAQWDKGVITASAGNHGLGVAYATQALGLPPATIFVPENTPATKVQRLGEFRCRLRRAGADYDGAHAVAEQVASERGALYLSAYDDPIVIAGQGTAGLEVLQDLPDVDLFLVPVGGGGLIAGIAAVAKAANPDIRVIGLQPEASPAALLSLEDGRPYETYPAGPTICDGLAGGFGRLPFEVAAGLIDDILIVPESDIRRAVAWLLLHEQIVVEGSGAIAVAPLLTGDLDLADRKAVAVLTGRNIDAGLLQAILEEYPSP